MVDQKVLSPEELRERAVRFYNRYGKDLEQIKSLLEIRLTQLALAYTLDNKLPPEAVKVSARVKTLSSFLKKLEKKNWPTFYYPTEVVGDLIGARVVCWFVDDCQGFLKLIKTSHHLKIEPEVEDYITSPKASGYRSIHLIGNIAYDGIKRDENQEVTLTSQELKCEIQIRTKLQDAWGDVTHEFHYKAKNFGVEDNSLEELLSDISERLATEDRTLIKFRKAYQRLADEKVENKTREGFKERASSDEQKHFGLKLFTNLKDALLRANELGRPIFAVVFDPEHPKKSKLDYSLGYFLEYQTTKKLVENNFVAALLSSSEKQVAALVPKDDPLENCRLVIISPEGVELHSEGLYANPDEGLRRVKSFISQWVK